MTDIRNIRHRPDGSIDLEHYDQIARGLRARDQRAGVERLTRPIARLMRTLRARGFGRRAGVRATARAAP